MGVKIWVDDVRPAPNGYIWLRTTNDVTTALSELIEINSKPRMIDTIRTIEILDLDHDSGDYYSKGGDYINILKFMEEKGINNIPIHIHSQNSVGVQNMRAIIEHNNWKEIK